MDKKVEQLFYAAMGGALAVKEKIETAGEELHSRHEKNAENARTFIDEMAQRGEQEKQQLRDMLKDNLKEIIDELDLATKDDLERLKQQLHKPS